MPANWVISSSSVLSFFEARTASASWPCSRISCQSTAAFGSCPPWPGTSSHTYVSGIRCSTVFSASSHFVLACLDWNGSKFNVIASSTIDFKARYWRTASFSSSRRLLSAARNTSVFLFSRGDEPLWSSMVTTCFLARLSGDLDTCGYSGPRITSRASGSSGTSPVDGGHACTRAKSPLVRCSSRSLRLISSRTLSASCCAARSCAKRVTLG